MQTDSQPGLIVSAGDLASFDYNPRTRVVFGAGSVDRLGELACELGGSRILLVTDKGLAEAGHEQHGIRALESTGLAVTVFDDVHPNPTTDDVDRCLHVAGSAQIDLIVGLGGGSSMDCAKGCNFLLTNGGRMEDYRGIGKAARPLLSMIAVPTTAGTGSEAQSFALIANAETHMKMACGDVKAACAIAILDPELTSTMPGSVASATAIDALSHAVETFVTKPRNPISQLFGRKAWQLLSCAFPRIFEEAEDVDARGGMLLAAHFAGVAVENSMLGATHALANPLTAHFGTTHGFAIGVMLPHVIRFNSPAVGPLYSDLARAAGICDAHDPNAPERLARHVQDLVELAGAPTRLADLGVDPDLLPTLANEASGQWTAGFNPRPVTVEQFEELYQCAL